jgi:hypothetical protein
LSRPIMANSRCESHHRNGITDPECLQQTFTTKSAQSGQSNCRNKCALSA